MNPLAFRIAQERKKEALQDPRWEQYRNALKDLPKFRSNHCVIDQDIVSIGSKDELTSAQQERLDESLRAFIPWKKGPFNIFQTMIDSEWRSDLKWDRIKDELNKIGTFKVDINFHSEVKAQISIKIDKIQSK